MASVSENPAAEALGLRPPTLSQRVLEELRHQLARCRFLPGERISVDRLAAEFDVSPLPVREALRVLLAEGRVEYSAHRGYRMATLTLADVEEIFLMCRALELEALRRGVPELTDDDAERMRELLERLEAWTDDVASWELAAVHQAFHFVPIECAGLPRLEGELRKLWSHTDHYRALSVFQDEITHRALQIEHREIHEACARRDAALVVELMDHHREHAVAAMVRCWDAAPEEEGR